MWNAKNWAGGAVAALALAAAGCADNARNGPTEPSYASETGSANAAANADPRGRIYDQVEFLGNPLVSEVTIVKANHNTYNRTMPYNSAPFKAETERFITGVAGRPQGYATAVADVLYHQQSDMLIVDSSKPASTSGWLTWALGSPYFSGNMGWGGRNLSDDVVDVGLIAIFSNNPLESTTGSCAPGQLPLCTDNVGSNDKAFSTTFPYLAAPTL